MTQIEPELWVERVADAITFYGRAFGAEVLHRVGDEDNIVARLEVDDARFWVATANRSSGRHDPQWIDGATGRLLLVVEDPCGCVNPISTTVLRDNRIYVSHRDRRREQDSLARPPLPSSDSATSTVAAAIG
jgi:PhnB protein